MNVLTQDDMQEPRNHGFTIGLLTGTVVGAGLAMWFAPRLAAELRQRVTDSATRLSERASAEYERASARVGATVDNLTRKGQEARNDVADAVAHGAHEVERYAIAAKSDRVTDHRKDSAADRSASMAHSL
jgi:gas vesicle protein